jgi:ABC-type transport system involved in multi-copper enzyme maturation permease subunit
LTPLFVWVLGAGIIGRDIASGVAHLLFTRPLTRASYILTKWVALTASVWAVQISVLLVWALGNLYFRGQIPFDTAFFETVGIGFWLAATLSSVVILFSSILPGLGDLALLLYVHVVLGVFGIYALASQNEHFKAILVQIFYFFWPGMALAMHFKQGAAFAPTDFLLDSGITVFFVAAAIFIFSKKDISYTAD